MMSDPGKEAPGAEATPGADYALQKPEFPAADLVQKDESRGSWASDDPERPRWDRDTVVQAIYDYHHEDGTYSCSKIKGKRQDGEKALLTGQLWRGSDLEIEKANWPEQFYRFPGLTNYTKGKGDEPNLLYRLPELKREMIAQPDEVVIIAEGEKDTDTLWDQGFIATTNPDGAGKWRHEFNAHLAGRHIAVVADNDEKGRWHAGKVARSLVPVAASVKIINLPGLQPNEDFTDWIEAGHTREQFLALIEATGAEEDFVRDEDGKPLGIQRNVRLAIKLMGVTVRYNDFAARYEVSGLRGFGSLLDDAALTRTRLQAEERYRLTVGKERWCDIVTDTARRDSYHPVCEYLDKLQWDGVNRIDRWLCEYGGANDSEYVRAVAGIVLTAAVRRVRQPGCKFDEMLVLESEQGTNKSSALAVLAIRDDWFTDDVPLDAESRVLMERIGGRWLVEMAEMKGLKRSEVESVKSMLSRRTDKARMAYGRMTTEQPRQCVFVGTTNDSAYLRDMTGNRRFWPVRVQAFDLAALRRDRDQLWAEAAVRYRLQRQSQPDAGSQCPAPCSHAEARLASA
jgi:predicted P-loop ATPase